jgi:hypothetical protein
VLIALPAISLRSFSAAQASLRAAFIALQAISLRSFLAALAGLRPAVLGLIGCGRSSSGIGHTASVIH